MLGCGTQLLFSCSVVSDSSVTPWTVAHLTPLSVGFPRQEYWSGLLWPPPEDLPDPGIEPASPELAGRLFTNCAIREAPCSPGSFQITGLNVH